MSIDKNTNEGKNYRNNVVKSTFGTSKSRINTGFLGFDSPFGALLVPYFIFGQ